MTEKQYKLFNIGSRYMTSCGVERIDDSEPFESMTECCEELNRLAEENEQLRKDLIDHSALISMLEDYQALKIEDILWNLTDVKSEEEFNELYKLYMEKAKRSWR